jgi:Abortive infection alpha
VGEKSKIRDAADAVRGVLEAVPVYEDALQPAARQIGAALETLAKAIRVALAPIAVLVWGYDQIEQYLVPAVEDRLRHTKAEDVVTPDPTVAGPLIEALRFAGHNESLRELYANLLATAMDKSTARLAHPAFVEILRQMSPDEARLVRYFGSADGDELGFVSVCSQTKNSGVFSYAAFRCTFIGQSAECEHPDLTSIYLDNLQRLGVIEMADNDAWVSEAAELAYARVESCEDVLMAMAEIKATEDRVPRLERGRVRITDLGWQFIEATVLDRRDA